jgi:hypothetical protein
MGSTAEEPMVCRLSAGGDWIRTSSTRAREVGCRAPTATKLNSRRSRLSMRIGDLRSARLPHQGRRARTSLCSTVGPRTAPRAPFHRSRDLSISLRSSTLGTSSPVVRLTNATSSGPGLSRSHDAGSSAGLSLVAALQQSSRGSLEKRGCRSVIAYSAWGSFVRQTLI